jgi:hypothetical protein
MPPNDDEKAYLTAVMWAAVDDESVMAEEDANCLTSPKPIGHCSLTSLGLQPVLAGRMYR